LIGHLVCLGIRFASDSLLEGDGFELPVPGRDTVKPTLWNTFKRITAGCSHTEKLALYSGTAVACGFAPRSVRGVAAGAEPEVRIHLPPAASLMRT
jgi:hypothetical protein